MSTLLNKFSKYIKHPKYLVNNFICRHPALVSNDYKYLRIKYEMLLEHPLDLDNPTTFNEKLQWLKLYYRKPELTTLVDKVAVKEYISNVIGSEYVIPMYGAWDSVDDIDWDNLPKTFVLKTNHDSSGVVICKDKEQFDKKKAAKYLKKRITHDNYSLTREWPYKHIRRKILCEKYMEDETGQLKDYKFFCFDGAPKYMFIASDRIGKEETKFDYFDMDFNRLNLRQSHPNSNGSIEKPVSFELMKQLAEKLSQGLPHVRVDFYQVNGRVYFGEITLFHYSGFTPFYPSVWDKKFGDLIVLPSTKITAD